MLIQWYPGHMTKAMRMMQDNIKLVDSVIYVLDSRTIRASFNDEFDKLIGEKPVLYVLNKCDLVEKEDLKAWVEYFKAEKKTFVVNNSTSAKNRNEIVTLLRRINIEKLKRYAKKGATMSVRAMVVGVPNCGKSTLINSLCGTKRAITGDKAGVTRGKQWVVLADGVELMDTPGTLPPSLKNQTLALHLAFIGSVKEEILNLLELSFEIIKFMIDKYPKNLRERYKLDSIDGGIEEIFNKIGKNRGFILKGGVIDEDRTSRAIIDDLKKQRMGKLIFERPEEDYPIE